MSNNSKTGRDRPIHGQLREILWNVHDFMTKEAQEAKNCVFTPERFQDEIERTARATNVPRGTVIRIFHDKRIQEPIPAGPSNEPKKKRKEGRRKTRQHLYLDDYEYSNVRRKIYQLHFVEKLQVTIPSILSILDKTGFPGDRGHVRQIVKELGFKFKQYDSCKKVLIESYKVRLLRIKYLTQVQMYRREGRHIVYGNEMCIHLSQNNEIIISDELGKVMRNQYSKKITFLHAGSTNGFVPNALLITVSVVGDQSNVMNKEKYEMWLRKQLIPNLQQNTIFVVDHATYCMTLDNKAPRSNATKKTMQDWLTCNNIQFDPTLLKPELYDIVKHHKHNYEKYSLDTIMESHGHRVLTLPPYYPTLNPMKTMSMNVREYLLAEYEVDMDISEVKHFITEQFATWEREIWIVLYNEAFKTEDKALKLEASIDALERLTRGNCTDSSSSSGTSHKQLSSNESSDTSSDAESEPLQSSSSSLNVN